MRVCTIPAEYCGWFRAGEADDTGTVESGLKAEARKKRLRLPDLLLRPMIAPPQIEWLQELGNIDGAVVVAREMDAQVKRNIQEQHMGDGAPATLERAAATSAAPSTEVEDVEDEIDDTYQSSVWAKSMIASLTLRKCGVGGSARDNDNGDRGGKRKSSNNIVHKKKFERETKNGHAVATRQVGGARRKSSIRRRQSCILCSRSGCTLTVRSFS